MLLLNPLFNRISDSDFIYLVQEGFYLRIRNSEINSYTLSALERGFTFSAGDQDPDRLNLELLDHLVQNKAVIHCDEAKTILEQKNLGLFLLKSNDPVKRMQSFQSKKIAVIGLGGIGTVIIENLVRFGLKNFVLIDPDTVSASDLNRQVLYMLEDVGRAKTKAVEAYIKRIDPAAFVECHAQRISGSDMLQEIIPGNTDFIIQAADYPLRELNEAVNDFCYHNRKAFINSACGLEKGYWGPIVDYKRIDEKIELAASFSDEYSEEENYLYASLSQPAVYSYGPGNMITAAHAASDIISYLSGLEAHSYLCRVFLNIGSLSYHQQPVYERVPDSRN